MGSVAASGGYYLAAPATRIFASRTTLTGSIGVVGGKLAVGKALGKIGVTGFPVGRGKRALLWSSLAPWTADERAAIRALMEGTYRIFLARVGEGRKKSAAELEPIAQGRVWTGAAARERGLVDELGGLDDALAAARELAKLDEKAPLEVYPPPPTLADLIAGLGDSSLPFGMGRAAAEAARDLAPREAAAVLAAYRLVAGFATARVQTAMIWPVVLR
jgi:protease-4